MPTAGIRLTAVDRPESTLTANFQRSLLSVSPVAVHHSKKTAESPTACAMAVTTADLCPAGKGRTRSHPHAPRLCSPEHACGAEHAWRIAAESMATQSQLQCCALQCHGLLTYPRLPRAGMRISRRVYRTARASYLHTRKAAGPAPSTLQMGKGMWSAHGCCAAAAHLWSAAEVLGRERGTRPVPLGRARLTTKAPTIREVLESLGFAPKAQSAAIGGTAQNGTCGPALAQSRSRCGRGEPSPVQILCCLGKHRILRKWELP